MWSDVQLYDSGSKGTVAAGDEAGSQRQTWDCYRGRGMRRAEQTALGYEDAAVQYSLRSLLVADSIGGS